MSSFYPVGAGRSTTQLTTTRLLNQIHTDQLAVQNLQNQLSTGRRISKPSEDPSAAIRALSAQRQLEYKRQVDSNLDSANVILSASESTLSQAQNILTEMRGLATQAASTTFSENETATFATQIQSAIQKLAELGNAKFRDQFIFSGSKVAQSPFEFVGDSVRFKGNAEELSTITDYDAVVAANITADDAFGAKSEKVVGRVDLNPSITADTPLSILNGGDGIRRGAISLSNGITVIEVDLSSAHNLSDVIERIESKQLGGRAISVSLSTNGLNISYTDGLGGLLRVDEVGSGNMAADLGINNSGTPGLSPVTGTDLNPPVTKSTKLSQLFGGTGINIGDLLQIKQGDKTYTITTNGLTTVEGFLNRIERSGAQVKASIDSSGRYLAIQSVESGTSLSIGEAGNTLAAKFGIRTFALDTPVSELNFGQGIFTTDLAPDLVITRTNGTEMLVDLDGVLTVSDVISRINNHVDNFTPSLRIVASLSTTGNGLVLTAPSGSQPIKVENAGGSQAAWGLGLVPRDQSSVSGTTSGTSNVLRGADVSGVEVEGVFTSLIRMRQAVENGTSEDFVRIAEALDADLQRMSLARSFIGTRQQSIDSIRDLSAEQQVQLKQIESDELDADLATVISDLNAREAALQASLKLMGQSVRQTLFDYL